MKRRARRLPARRRGIGRREFRTIVDAVAAETDRAEVAAERQEQVERADLAYERGVLAGIKQAIESLERTLRNARVMQSRRKTR